MGEEQDRALSRTYAKLALRPGLILLGLAAAIPFTIPYHLGKLDLSASGRGDLTPYIVAGLSMAIPISYLWARGLNYWKKGSGWKGVIGAVIGSVVFRSLEGRPNAFAFALGAIIGAGLGAGVAATLVSFAHFRGKPAPAANLSLSQPQSQDSGRVP